MIDLIGCSETHACECRIVDNLPAVECTDACLSTQPAYHTSFPLGCVYHNTCKTNQLCSVCVGVIGVILLVEMEDVLSHRRPTCGDVFLSNHVDIVMSYHESSEFIVWVGGVVLA